MTGGSSGTVGRPAAPGELGLRLQPYGGEEVQAGFEDLDPAPRGAMEGPALGISGAGCQGRGSARVSCICGSFLPSGYHVLICPGGRVLCTAGLAAVPPCVSHSSIHLWSPPLGQWAPCLAWGL